MQTTRRSGFAMAGIAGLLVLLATGVGLVLLALPQQPQQTPVNPAAQRAEMIRLLRSIDARLAAMQKNQAMLLAALQGDAGTGAKEKPATGTKPGTRKR